LKKILLIGETDQYGSSTIEIANSLIDLGFEVESFNFRTIANNYNKINSNLLIRIINFTTKILLKLNLSKNLYYKVLGRYEMNKDLEKKINSKYSYVLFTKNDLVNPILIKKSSLLNETIYYFFDTIKEINIYYLHNHFRYAKRAYIISETTAQILSKTYQKKIHYCPQGIDLKIWHPQKKTKDIDVLFVGTKFRNRVKVIDFLKKNNVNIECYGIGWDNGTIYEHDLCSLYNRAKIILNFTRDQDSYSLRCYQVLATNSFLLSTYSNEIINKFKIGYHLDIFQNNEDLLKKIHFYIQNEQIRKKIAKESYEFVIKKYNWNSVLKRLLIND
tara:strand:+ start:694 stop:1686 length:993 start_codon:yes stop_codon:yes gene_type:complete